MTEKYEWRKAERSIYPTMKRLTITTIPAQTFITLSGQGDPNTAPFGDKVAALYAISYSIKWHPKRTLSFLVLLITPFIHLRDAARGL